MVHIYIQESNPESYISEVIDNLDQLQFEFIADFRDDGLHAGTIFIMTYFRHDPVVAFNFYTKLLTDKAIYEAKLNRTYNSSDFKDTLTDITISKPAYDINDISRIIRYWVNKNFYSCVLKPMFLIYRDTKIPI